MQATALQLLEDDVRELIRRRRLDPSRDEAEVRELIDEVLDDYDERIERKSNSLLDSILMGAAGASPRIRDDCGVTRSQVELPNGYEPFLPSLTPRVQGI